MEFSEGKFVFNYEECLDKLIDRLVSQSGAISQPELRQLLITSKDKLIANKNKIIHDQLMLILVNFLFKNGFKTIDVEHDLDSDLRCDIFTVNARKIGIIEVETPITNPNDIIKFDLTPFQYHTIRSIGKLRYSLYADDFYLAYPDYINLTKCNSVYEFFYAKRKERDIHKAKELEKIASRVYKKPPITREELMKAHLDGIYLVDVEGLTVEYIKYF